MLAAAELGIGLGFTHYGHDTEEDTSTGVSLDADFNNGFRAILNRVDMGDDNDSGDDAGEQCIGIDHTVDDWTIAANWARITEDVPNTDEDCEKSGCELVVNCDPGGGAEFQPGYGKTSCGEYGSRQAEVIALFLSDAFAPVRSRIPPVQGRSKIRIFILRKLRRIINLGVKSRASNCTLEKILAELE